jgi:hypothetical protein
VVEVVPFTSPLANTSEHRETRVFHGDIADQLHEGHGLTHTRAAKQADLSTLGNRHDQVNNLDASFQDLGATGLV